MIKIYEGIGRGENLWKAINNTGYGCQDPPLVQKWIDEQIKAYMEKEWDHEYIRDYIDKFQNSELDLFFDILRDHSIYIDDPFYGEINRDDLQIWANEYLSKKTETRPLTNFDELQKDYNVRMRKRNICLKLYNFIIEDLELDYQSKRWESAHSRASDDLQIFSDDLDIDNDDEVRQFFGIKAEMVAYEVDGQEYAPEEVFICPNCSEARPIEKQKEDWQGVYDEPYNSSIFICDDCGDERDVDDKGFLEVNKQVPQEELVARCV